MANHKGSAGTMEIVGTKRIFRRSAEKHGLRYVKFLGDSDSKSFPAVEDIFEEIKVEKLESTGHVQKRVGNRLRNLKKKVKGLGGRGCLTNNIIDKLQNYYGMAIQQNSGDLNAMKNATAASPFHDASSATDDYHTRCPSGSDSWCLFKADKANNTSSYKSGHAFGYYQELCSDSLLKKCTHGQIQNQNETFNGMIWHHVPKHTYVGRQTFETGVFNAVAHFNIGNLATLRIFKSLGIEPGIYTRLGCSASNKDRVENARCHNKATYKLRQQIICGNRKQKADEIEGVEGKLYCPGIAR